MSERFPDEVLREAHHAYTLVWDVTFDSSRDVDAANAAAIAAMRAVLEGQAAQERSRRHVHAECPFCLCQGA